MPDSLGLSTLCFMQERQIIVSIGKRRVTRKRFSVGDGCFYGMMHLFQENPKVKMSEGVVRSVAYRSSIATLRADKLP
jgi:hypothetical protein